MKVTLRVANDYAAVIEGQRAGNIHIGYYGPASFARARIIGVKTDAFAIDVNSDGSKGYYSVFYVLAEVALSEDRGSQGQGDGLRRSELDLGQQHAALRARRHGHRSRNVLLQDRVRRQPRERGARARAGHGRRLRQLVERADDSNLTRMLNKGMLKNADGSPMKNEDFRIILKSPLIINSPYAYLSDLPDDMKAAIRAGVPRRRDQGPGGLRQTVRRQEPALAAGRERRLRRDDRSW